MNIATEGVLIFASANGLLNEYKDKEFDYDFPEGISKLLEQQTIIALTTSEGDNLIIEFTDDNKLPEETFDNEIEQVIVLQPNDKLLILSHANFTQICSQHGNSENYRWPIEKIENLEAGQYLIKIRIKDTSQEFEKYQAYFKLNVSIKKTDTSEIVNMVLDLSN